MSVPPPAIAGMDSRCRTASAYNRLPWFMMGMLKRIDAAQPRLDSPKGQVPPGRACLQISSAQRERVLAGKRWAQARKTREILPQREKSRKLASSETPAFHGMIAAHEGSCASVCRQQRESVAPNDAPKRNQSSRDPDRRYRRTVSFKAERAESAAAQNDMFVRDHASWQRLRFAEPRHPSGPGRCKTPVEAARNPVSPWQCRAWLWCAACIPRVYTWGVDRPSPMSQQA